MRRLSQKHVARVFLVPSLHATPLFPPVESTEAMLQRSEKDLLIILAVAKKSGNLKGTCQKELKDTAESFRGTTDYLARRSSTDKTQRLEREVSHLKEENDSLRRELDELKNQVVALQTRKRERRAREEQRRNGRRHVLSSSSSRSRSSRKAMKNGGDSSPPPAQRPKEKSLSSPPAGLEKPTSPPQASSTLTPTEEFARRMMEQVGLMMSARFEALEDRLLPEKQLRPPLGRKANPPPPPNSSEPRAAPYKNGSRDGGPKKTSDGPSTRGNTGAKRERKAPPALQISPTTSAACAAAASLLPSANAWMEVTQQERKKKGSKRTATVPKTPNLPREKGRTLRVFPTVNEQGSATQKAPTRRGGQKSGKSTVFTPSPPTPKSQPKAKSSKAPKPPKSAAMVLTFSPEAGAAGQTYAKILTIAKAKIKLADIGIESLKCRRTITGARMLEVSGEERGAKTDMLAARLTTALGHMDVRIARPVKCAELRLTGLDDSVTAAEIAEALATQGGCQREEIRVGDIRTTSSGNGMVWTRCPINAATKVATVGQIKVGWTIVRVQLLQARPLQCYRCFEMGHTKQRCTAEVDRSDCCYRCGQPGHRTVQCTGEVHCPVCAVAGRPAGHRCGGRACKPPPRNRKTRGAPSISTPRGPTAGGKPTPLALVERKEAGRTSTSPTPMETMASGVIDPPMQQQVPPEEAMTIG